MVQTFEGLTQQIKICVAMHIPRRSHKISRRKKIRNEMTLETMDVQQIIVDEIENTSLVRPSREGVITRGSNHTYATGEKEEKTIMAKTLRRLQCKGNSQKTKVMKIMG